MSHIRIYTHKNSDRLPPFISSNELATSNIGILLIIGLLLLKEFSFNILFYVSVQSPLVCMNLWCPLTLFPTGNEENYKVNDLNVEADATAEAEAEAEDEDDIDWEEG